MAIKKYSATADSTISNAFKLDLLTRATGSNMGAADVVEIFHIYAQASLSSSEDSRALVKFDVDQISTDRTNGDLPASGSVSFYLRMFNTEHAYTTPKNYEIIVSAVAEEWEEGHGIDMESYLDVTKDGVGVNWVRTKAGESWTTQGGEFYNDASSSFTASFDTGFENIELDITNLVEQWVDSSGNVLGAKTNYGVGLRLNLAYETASTSYYTKKFFARSSEYFFKRPIIEARWDSSEKDQRDSFYYSSSLAPAADNLNSLYLYNLVRGQYQNIPSVGSGSIYVSLYSGSSTTSTPAGNPLELSSGGDVPSANDTIASGSWNATGIYKVQLAVTASAANAPAYLHDVWFDSSGVEFYTGSIIPNTLAASKENPNSSYVTSITNLKNTYSIEETARFRLFVRDKNWNPNIYTVASQDVPNKVIEDAYYKIYRIADNFLIADYGTGSLNHTRLSYDSSGNYFDFDIAALESSYMYAIKLIYKLGTKYREQKEVFKFRVE